MPPVRGDQKTIASFSSGATRQAVWDSIWKHSLTIYPTGVGLAGVLGMALLDPSLITFLLTVGGLGIGVGSFVVNYCFRGKTFESRYIQKLHHELVRQREEALASLERGLKTFSESVKGAEGYAEQGIEQFKMVRERFESLQKLLAEKLSGNELTFIRFNGTAEQLYLAILDNLRHIASLLQSVSIIDEGYINTRLRSLAKLKNPAEADQKEIKTLQERNEIRSGQLEKINDLLTQNEEALTQMDKTAVTIAEMKTLKAGEASVDLETARKDLEELALRVQKYSKTESNQGLE